MPSDISAIALAVGAGLVVFPEPATTATGLAIIVASVGLEGLDDAPE